MLTDASPSPVNGFPAPTEAVLAHGPGKTIEIRNSSLVQDQHLACRSCPATPNRAPPSGRSRPRTPTPLTVTSPWSPRCRRSSQAFLMPLTLTRLRSQGTDRVKFCSVWPRLSPQFPRAGAGSWRELTPQGQVKTGPQTLKNNNTSSEKCFF